MNGIAESFQPSEESSGRSNGSLLSLKFPFLSQTASTLVVADARISGIYSCVASNKVGTVERNINFYITGKQYTLYSQRSPGDLDVLSICFLVHLELEGFLFLKNSIELLNVE